MWGNYSSKYTWGTIHPSTRGGTIRPTYLRQMYQLLTTRLAGKQFINETTKLMNELLQDSPLKDITFKVIMIVNLFLQKPSKNSKFKNHLKPLENHIK